MCDELFGRRNFIANVIWQKRTSRENRAAFSVSHDHLFVYALMPGVEWKRYRNLLPSSDTGFSNPDGDGRGPWRSTPFTAQGFRPNQMYEIRTPTGVIQLPPKGRCWAATESVFKQYLADKRIYFPKGGDGKPRVKVFSGEESGLVPSTIWEAVFAGDTEQAKKEMLSLYPDQEAFDTPKPEELLQRVLEIATNPGDIVLDSFAGSGTTGAVAHKMGRRWIMVELGDHCHTHVIPRLRKVIDGIDLGGITSQKGWRCGGGYRYFRLAPSMLLLDRFGNQVINPKYKPEMLAEAMCKHLGFNYEPSRDHYWMQGHSSETDFLYVTTQTVTQEQMVALADEVGDDRTLLVCCSAWRGNPDLFPKLTFKKIPPVVLSKCEWGQDDYSSFVANLKRIDPDAIPGTLFDQDNLAPVDTAMEDVR